MSRDMRAELEAWQAARRGVRPEARPQAEDPPGHGETWQEVGTPRAQPHRVERGAAQRGSALES